MAHTPTPRAVIAANLERLMAARGQANRRLGRLAGVGEGTVQRVRTGQVSVTADNLESLARALGVEAWMLLVPNLDPANLPVIAFPSAADRALYERFRALMRDATKPPE